MPGDAADQELEPDPWFNICAVSYLDCLKADVVGVFESRDRAAAIKGDVELSRESVERALVEHMEVPCARIGARVDELLRVNACCRIARHIANVVGARAARGEAKILHTLDDMKRVSGRDLPQLEVCARCYMRVAAAEFLSQIGKPRELPLR